MWWTTRRRDGCGWATRPGPRTRARAVHAIVAPAWDVTLSEQIVHDQWHKLLWNAGFNAICAVTGATAGEALATPVSEELVRAAMWEVVAVAARHGVTLTADDVDEMAAPQAGAARLPPLHRARPGRRQAARARRAVRVPGARGRRARGARPVNRVLDGLLALQEDRRAAPVNAFTASVRVA